MLELEELLRLRLGWLLLFLRAELEALGGSRKRGGGGSLLFLAEEGLAGSPASVGVAASEPCEVR